MASNLLASLLLVAMPGAPSSFLFLVGRPGAPSSVLAPNSDGLQPNEVLWFVMVSPFGFSQLAIGLAARTSRPLGNPPFMCLVGEHFQAVFTHEYTPRHRHKQQILFSSLMFVEKTNTDVC